LIISHLEGLKYEHTKKIIGFVNWVSQSMLTKLTNFEALPEQLQCKRHRTPPKLGIGEAYLSIGSILAQFGGL